MGRHGQQFSHSPIGGIVCIVIIAVIIAVTVWLIVKLVQKYNQGSFSSNGTLRILEERYVRGEIDELEFETKKKVLGFDKSSKIKNKKKLKDE